jgi:hypothetical protein
MSRHRRKSYLIGNMPPSLITARVVLIGLILMALPIHRATGAEAHLLPVGPTFDVGEPIGKTYARILETTIFSESSWLVRYYSATESATTGLAIAKSSSGNYRLSIKKTKPELGSVVANAFYRKQNLGEALKRVKTESASAEIPETVALAIYRVWLSLLRDVYIDEKLNAPYLLSAEIQLYAKTPDGKTLGGRMPPGGFKYRNLAIADKIVDDLFKVPGASKRNQQECFDRIERNAAALKR